MLLPRLTLAVRFCLCLQSTGITRMTALESNFAFQGLGGTEEILDKALVLSHQRVNSQTW